MSTTTFDHRTATLEEIIEHLAGQTLKYRDLSAAKDDMIAAYDFLVLALMEVVREPYGPSVQRAIDEWRAAKREFDNERHAVCSRYGGNE